MADAHSPPGLVYPNPADNPAISPSHRGQAMSYRKGPGCPECGTPFSHINGTNPDEKSPGVQRFRACANGHRFQTAEFVVDSIKTLREWTKHVSPAARGVVTKVLEGVIEAPAAVRLRAAESILERQERMDFIDEAKGTPRLSIDERAALALSEVDDSVEVEVKLLSEAPA